MPIQFLLRKYMKESLYKKAISNLINMDGNVLILSTGYIHNSKSSNSKAIEELADEINNIKSRPMLYLTIVIVGGEKDNINGYPNNFINFCNELYKNITDKSKIKIIFRRVIGDNWHGKVAIKLRKDIFGFSNNKYYGALLGSSNLTPINILDGEFGWNKESDLYIVDGNLNKNLKLNKIKELCCSKKFCDEEIGKNVYKINTSINSIKKINKIIKLEFVNKKDDKYSEQLETLRNRCKEYLKTNPDKDTDYLFISILQSLGDIGNMYRINTELDKSFDSLEEPWCNLREKAQKLNKEYFEVYNKYEEFVNMVYKLDKKRDELTFDDFEELYNKIGVFQKEFEGLRKNNKNTIILDFFNELDMFREHINIVRKNLIALKTVYDLKADGAYIESILKGIYIEIEDIIKNFTNEELSL